MKVPPAPVRTEPRGTRSAVGCRCSAAPAAATASGRPSSSANGKPTVVWTAEAPVSATTAASTSRGSPRRTVRRLPRARSSSSRGRRLSACRSADAGCAAASSGSRTTSGMTAPSAAAATRAGWSSSRSTRRNQQIVVMPAPSGLGAVGGRPGAGPPESRGASRQAPQLAEVPRGQLGHEREVQLGAAEGVDHRVVPPVTGQPRPRPQPPQAQRVAGEVLVEPEGPVAQRQGVDGGQVDAHAMDPPDRLREEAHLDGGMMCEQDPAGQPVEQPVQGLR